MAPWAELPPSERFGAPTMMRLPQTRTPAPCCGCSRCDCSASGSGRKPRCAHHSGRWPPRSVVAACRSASSYRRCARRRFSVGIASPPVVGAVHLRPGGPAKPSRRLAMRGGRTFGECRPKSGLCGSRYEAGPRNLAAQLRIAGWTAAESQCAARGRVSSGGTLRHQCSRKNRPSRPVFYCPESRVGAGFRAVLPVPRAPGTVPETGPVRLPLPVSSPLTLTNWLRLAPAKLLLWREVTRVSRRAVGVDDWSSNRVERTEGRRSPGRTRHAVQAFLLVGNDQGFVGSLGLGMRLEHVDGLRALAPGARHHVFR